MKPNKHAQDPERGRITPAGADRRTKHELALAINNELRQRGLSQPAAAVVLHMPQPNISALVNYRLAGFSVQRLIRILNGLGKDVVIQVADKRATDKAGKTSVTAA